MQMICVFLKIGWIGIRQYQTSDRSENQLTDLTCAVIGQYFKYNHNKKAYKGGRGKIKMIAGPFTLAVGNSVFRKNQSIQSVCRRFLQISPVACAKMVKVGDSVPSVDLFEDLPTNKVNIAELSKGKKVIIFAVPGAFTPGCSKTHLPGYVSKAEELKGQGISEIVCVSVNDPFVMAAWAKDQKTGGKVRLLADPSAAFAKALDLTVDIPPLGGVRSKRYSMVVEDGKITQLQVEPDGTGLSCSLAEKLKL